MRRVVILIRCVAKVKNLVAHGQELLYWVARFSVASSYDAPLLLRMTSFHHDHLDSILGQKYPKKRSEGGDQESYGTDPKPAPYFSVHGREITLEFF